MTPEQGNEERYLPYSIRIPGADQYLILANCPYHGDGTYFKRVQGDTYECAHLDHHGGSRQQVDRLRK